jgi:hypothetical protein
LAVDNEKVTQDKKFRFGKVVLVLVGLWLLLVAGLLIALQSPAVQTRLVHKGARWLSEKIDHPVSIHRVNISWFDELTLEGVKVYDAQDSLMIGVDHILVDFDLISLLFDSPPRIDGVRLQQPFVQLIKNSPDSGLNINRFIRNIQDLLPPQTKTGKKKVPFIIDRVQIEGGTFVFHNPHADSLEDIFDYNHFRFQNIQAQARELTIVADTIQTNIGLLQAYSSEYDFQIDTLRTFFSYANTGMLFDKLLLRAGNTTLRDSVVFRYRDQESLEYFQDSVHIYARLRNSVLHSRELGIFAPALESYGDTYRISGDLSGRFSYFDIDHMDLQLGERSRMRGYASMDGLPNIMETFIELDLTNSYLHPPDLRPYIAESFYENLEKLGNMQFSGQFLGFPNDFVANGTFQTWLGLIRSDINLKLHDDPLQSTYSGNLTLVDFQLGKLIDNPMWGLVSGQGSISGQGLSLETARLQLDASIRSMQLRGYTYQNIGAEGQLARSFFAGKLSVNDPNLRLIGEGSINMGDGKNQLRISAQLDTARFRELGLMTDTLIVSGAINLNMQGLELDEFQGDAELQNLYVFYQGRELFLDSLTLINRLEDEERLLSLRTNLLNLDVEGRFNYSTLSADLQRLYREYMLNFRNNEEELRAYYTFKERPEHYDRYRLDYSLLLKDANPLLRILEPGIYVSENTLVEGHFTGGYTSILSAYTTIDTLLLNENRLYDLQAEFTSSKIADSTEVLAMAYLSSQQQHFQGFSPTRSLVTEAIWNQDRISFTSAIREQDGDNYANANAELFFLANETHLQFTDTETKLIENVWRLKGNNLIVFRGDKILINNLELFHQDQSIRADGILSPAAEDTLQVGVNNLQLANLNPILDQKLSGVVNGQLLMQEVLGKPLFRGELHIDSLAVNEFLAGDFMLKTGWDNQEEKLYLDILGRRQGQQILTATGYYNPLARDNQLNLEAQFDKAPLNLLEPFFGYMFSQIKGTTTGKVLVLGTPAYPIVQGGGVVEGGSLRINYLNTTYTFRGDILFSENEIGFRNLRMSDTEGNPAYLNGGVFHDGFDNFVINLKAGLQGTKVLNTSFSDNELYYGTAYATGEVEVLGPANNLWITATARSDKGTKIYIPIDFKNEAGTQSFVNFVSRSANGLSIASDTSRLITNEGSIKLDFDLDITPDAYVEIIFDMRAGDIIRGRGRGKLEMQIDTEGDFSMVGNYEIQQGAYNFTLFNVITKEFIIEPGSNIRWDGDPYGGILDIKARYQQMASLGRVLPQQADGAIANPLLMRPYPVVLGMGLEGDLMSPAITFNIDIQDYPVEFTNEISGFMNRLQSDEQLLNRQVFNLLVLRQFAPVDYGGAGFTAQSAGRFGSQTAVSSISELLANQFSALASQIDENLEIDVNYTSNINEAMNTFQLRLSYTFLNGRLRVTRDGSLVNTATPGATMPGAATNNFIGDWMVEYMLTKDGQYRVKLYNRANFRTLTADHALPDFTQGISLLQTKSFDTFRELFQRQIRRDTGLPAQLPMPDSSVEELLRLEEEEEEEEAVQQEEVQQ